MKKSSYSVVSLFAGCGGLDLGFRGDFKFLDKEYSKRKFKIIWANDFDENACKTYSVYFKHNAVCADIREVLDGKKGLEPLPKSSDVVLGGFPCQDFSFAGKRLGFDGQRGTLYRAMVEVVRRNNPLMFVAENVKGLLSMYSGGAIKQIVEDFSKVNKGYHVTYKLYLSADYEVPEMRERVVIVGTRKDKLPPFNHPEPYLLENEWITAKVALKDLEKLPAGAVANHFWSGAKKFKGQGNGLISADRPGPTMRAEHHGNIEFHWNGNRRLSAREAARIQSFPDDMIFYPSTSAAYKQIGNAVPPVMAWHVATAVQKFLDKNIR